MDGTEGRCSSVIKRVSAIPPQTSWLEPILASRVWLLTAATGSTIGALLHVVVALSGRADWVAYFRAPAVIVSLVRDGNWLGALAGLIIAALMQVAGLYALAAAGVLPRLPMMQTALAILAAIGTLRGLIIPLSLLFSPTLIDRYVTFDWVAAMIWGGIGICFAVGAAQAFTGSVKV